MSMITITSALVVSIITGLITLVSLLITKDKEVSEYRNELIKSFNSDLSELIGLVSTILMIAKITASTGQDDEVYTLSIEELNTLRKENIKSFERINTLISAVRLHINVKRFPNFVLALNDLESSFFKGLTKNGNMESLIRRVTREGDDVSTKIWLDIRDGEPLLKLVKTKLLPILLVISIIGLVYLVSTHQEIEKSQKASKTEQQDTRNVKQVVTNGR